MNEKNPMKTGEKLVICIGDIHGYHKKLENLWKNLETQSNPSEFKKALIIFLGDYCDRGPNTQQVIQFLLTLPTSYPSQTHVFLSGNHDLAFAAFVGAIPVPETGFSEGWREYSGSEEREGWYDGVGFENMHLQGRRWAGFIKVKFNTAKGVDYQGSIYDAAPTFHSYGVPHGSSDLMNAVPDDHKKFLADLVWVHEEDNVAIETSEGLKHCKLIAVHGGLQQDKPVNEQLKVLKARDTSISKVECLSGRKTIWDMPEELKGTPTIVVSGHHGKLHIDGLRLIIDEGGGYKDKPVAAIILPSMEIVRDTDVME